MFLHKPGGLFRMLASIRLSVQVSKLRESHLLLIADRQTSIQSLQHLAIRRRLVALRLNLFDPSHNISGHILVRCFHEVQLFIVWSFATQNFPSVLVNSRLLLVSISKFCAPFSRTLSHQLVRSRDVKFYHLPQSIHIEASGTHRRVMLHFDACILLPWEADVPRRNGVE